MIRAALKKVRSFVTPEAVLFAGAVVLATWSKVEQPVREVVPLYPYAVAVAGAAVAWRFHRSRLFFALAVLALAYYALTLGRGAPDRALLLQSAAILVPLNLAAIAWLPERGALSWSALRRWAAIALQVAAVVALARHGGSGLVSSLRRGLAAGGFFGWTDLGLPALLAFALAFAGLVLARLFASGTTARGYLWALAAAFLAFGVARAQPDRILYISTAGLILLVAVLESSYRMAYHDALTALPGRRALNEAIQRLAGEYSVALVDVDHFKRFNDRFGHDVGDQVLRMVASRLARVGGGGRAFRYGGEEFALLFPGKTVEECLPLLEELREAIYETRFTVRRRIRPRGRPSGGRGGGRRRTRVRITVSIGVAQKDEKQKTPEQVVQAADEALYKAKGAGRNRVRAAAT